jgi:uncharacterized membrane protein YvlD (DUF360 family)
MGGKGTLEPERKEAEEEETSSSHSKSCDSPSTAKEVGIEGALKAAGEHASGLFGAARAWYGKLEQNWLEQSEKAYQSELHELENGFSVNERIHMERLEALCEKRKKRIAECRKRLENIQRVKRGEPPLGDSVLKKNRKTSVWFVFLACLVTSLFLMVNQQAYYNEKIKVLKAENGRQLAKILEQQVTLSQKESTFNAQLEVVIEGYDSVTELYNALLEEHQKTLEQQAREPEEAVDTTEPARGRWANLFQKLDEHNPERKFVDEYADLIPAMYRDLCAQEGVTPFDKVLFHVATTLNGIAFRFHDKDSSDSAEMFWECVIQAFIIFPIFGISTLAVLCRPIYLLLTGAPSFVVAAVAFYVAVQVNEQRRASQSEEAGQQQQEEE